jgi:hypothetical protein
MNFTLLRLGTRPRCNLSCRCAVRLDDNDESERKRIIKSSYRSQLPNEPLEKQMRLKVLEALSRHNGRAIAMLTLKKASVKCRPNIYISCFAFVITFFIHFN